MATVTLAIATKTQIKAKCLLAGIYRLRAESAMWQKKGWVWTSGSKAAHLFCGRAALVDLTSRGGRALSSCALSALLGAAW